MEKPAHFSTEHSLKLITEMIHTAKHNVENSRFYFLLWGWVIVVANLAFYYLLTYTDFQKPYLVWLITVPAYIVSMVYGYRQRKKRRVKTILDKINMWTWITFAMNVFLLVLFGEKINWNINPVIMLMAAAATFITGILVNFRPLVYGSVALWLCGITSLLFAYELQFLLAALGAMLGFLIPGYLLKSQNV